MRNFSSVHTEPQHRRLIIKLPLFPLLFRSPLFTRIPIELIFWAGGLVYLILTAPLSQPPVEFCLLKRVGFDQCPGCGLGESIAWLLKGNVARSLEAHLLGPFAFAVIFRRIFHLVKQSSTIDRKEFHHA